MFFFNYFLNTITIIFLNTVLILDKAIRMLRSGRTNMPFTKRIKMLCWRPNAARSNSLTCPMNNCVTTIIPNEVNRATVPGKAIPHNFPDSFQTLLFRSSLLSSSGETSLSSIELSMILYERMLKLMIFQAFW